MNSSADGDKRPWEQRGFTEVKPVAERANQSYANERTGKYQLRPDGSDPKEGYPERQKAHPDAAPKNKKRGEDGCPENGPSWEENNENKED